MNVATIERVVSKKQHDNADSLEIVQILGWDVVCKKDEFQVGELVVFINIDSIVEPNTHFQFLASKNYRIKPIKIRGKISQGLCLSLKILKDFTNKTNFDEGEDISEIIKASHYEKPVPRKMTGKHKGTFPSFLIKTDEHNLRNYPHSLKEIAEKDIYMTKKMDGCSATYYIKNGNFGVCSRTLELQPDENIYWSIVKKYDLAYKLLSAGMDIAIQGEIYGPNIQGNPNGSSSICFAAFNLYQIKGNRYEGFDKFIDFCSQYEIPTVPMIYRGSLNHTLQDLIEIANSLKYENNSPCEGLVLRTTEPMSSKSMQKNMWSAKVLNENYDM